eukprot:TRINITY_DN22385_c0_g1_i1.p1 TRINITY_DN22385_c0_g1~~TRINITY_DN22385_c0_g1_i1.p1  ORF type:complete len:154 (+),score=36.00 TRINITY_DN22385_c0_g1_i1:189-650(+)
MRIGNSVLDMRLWDTAGQERFRSFVPMYFRDAMAAVVVFDITDRDSFESAKTWIQMVREEASDSVLATVLTGTKCDLSAKRVVSETEARAFAEGEGLLYEEVSSKTGTNIPELFLRVGQTLLTESESRRQMAEPAQEAVDLDQNAAKSNKCAC